MSEEKDLLPEAKLVRDALIMITVLMMLKNVAVLPHA